jgi:hypothetical protein
MARRRENYLQKKRPLKRAGVKPLGAKLYKRFLAGGMLKVVIDPSKDKANLDRGNSVPEPRVLS